MLAETFHGVAVRRSPMSCKWTTTTTTPAHALHMNPISSVISQSGFDGSHLGLFLVLSLG